MDGQEKKITLVKKTRKKIYRVLATLLVLVISTSLFWSVSHTQADSGKLGPSLTTNAEADWKNTGPTGVSILSLALNPARPQELYAGADDARGIWRSTDGGDTWTLVKSDVTGYALALDPGQPPVVYAGCWEGVFRSADGGETWTLLEADTTPRDIRALALDPTDSQVIYAGTLNGHVYRSADGGNTWTDRSVGLPTDAGINDLAIDPDHPATLYAATNEGIYKTTDSGETWTEVGNGLLDTAYYAVTINATITPSIVFVAGQYNPYYAGVYRSTDGGSHWELVNHGIVGANPGAMLSHKGKVYIATDAGLFYTTDGSRWRGLFPTFPGGNIGRAIAIADGTSTTIYLGLASGEEANRGVWRYTLSAWPPEAILPSVPPKAVVIVGPEAPPDVIADGEAIAQKLESYGLNVIRLYHPDATWENVRTHLQGASVVVYKGHGFGYDPADPMYVGTGGGNNGFCLTDPNNLSGAQLATQDMLIAYTQLAVNAVVVMNGACFTAGSAATDSEVISEEVAQRRVNDYAYTFLSIGARAYFANNYTEAPNQYFDFIFGSPHLSMGTVFQSTGYYDPDALRAYAHAQYPSDVLWLNPDQDSQGTVVGWNRAFAGDQDLRGDEIYLPDLQISPPRIRACMEPGTPGVFTRTVTLTCTHDITLSWQAEVSATGWLTITPLQGSVPGSATVTLSGEGLEQGTYIGTVNFSAPLICSD